MKRKLVSFAVGLGMVSMAYCNIGNMSLPVLALDYLGQQEAAEVGSGMSKEMIQEAAEALYQGIELSDSGMLDGYRFGTVSDAKRVLFHLNFEVLNGKTSPIRVYKDGDFYTLGWENGDQVQLEHLYGTEYVNNAWEGIAETVFEFESEKEKVEYIAKFICDELILGYDFDENGNVSMDATRSIYDLSVSEDNKAVCIVYATLFDRLCERAGIQSEVVIGVKGVDSTESHSWNRVIIDGRETYYDLTNYAQVRSDYFLDMGENGFYKSAQYREYENYELGYKAAINSVEKERTR